MRWSIPLPATGRGGALPMLDFEHARRSAARFGAVLIAVGLVVVGVVGLRLVLLEREIAQLSARPAAHRPVVPVAAPAARALSAKQAAQWAEQATAAVARLSVPWDAWLRQLEATAKGRVVLTSLQPEADGRQVRISGEARRFDDLVEYLMSLDASPAFANAFLSEHVEGGGVISFTLSVDWVSGS